MQHPRFFTRAWWQTLSKWWVAMLLTNFITGILLVYGYPESTPQLLRGTIAISLFTGMWFIWKASYAHFARYRGESQDNTTTAFILTALFGIALAAAYYWQAPRVLQALLCGALVVSVGLLLKNYWVTQHLHHYRKTHD